MSSLKLLKSQENKLFKIIKMKALNPDNFDYKEKKTETAHRFIETTPMVIHKETSFYFHIRHFRELFDVEYCPGDETINQTKFSINWNDVIYFFEEWIDNLKREIEQPDLWGELLKSELVPNTSSISNEQFNEQEQKNISEVIDDIRAYIESEFTLLDDRNDYVNEKLEYLVSSAKRQGRKDWYFICIGIIVDLGMYLSMSPEQAKTILGFIKSSLIRIIQLLPPAPSGI